MALTVSIDALRPEIWQKKLFVDVMDKLYFGENGMMGEGENNIIEVKSDLKKQSGDTFTCGLGIKLSGNGVVGDAEREGQEEAMTTYSQSVGIDQISNQVLLTGRLDEQKVAYDMREEAKNKLSVWMREYTERQIFMKLAGVTTTTLTDVNGVTVSARATWSNSPNIVPTAHEVAGKGARYLCAETTGLANMAAADILTPAMIGRAKVLAQTASPKIRPLRIKGKDYYVLFIHPWQSYDLKHAASSVWAQAQRDAQVRGNENPIFTGALGIYDGVIIHEHEYVPVVVGDGSKSFSAAGTAVTNGVYAFRALLCGQQAGMFVQTKDTMRMVEKLFNYDSQPGYSASMIGGVQKSAFNSVDYGVVSIDTGATILV